MEFCVGGKNRINWVLMGDVSVQRTVVSVSVEGPNLRFVKEGCTTEPEK